MKNREFLERMIFLTQKMCDVYNQEPIDQKALYAVRKEVHEAGRAFDINNRRNPWFFKLLVWILFGILVGLVIRILFLN